MTDHKLSKDPSRLIHYQDVEIPEFDPGVYQSLDTYLLPRPPLSVGDIVRFREVDEEGCPTGRVVNRYIGELLDVDGTVLLISPDPLDVEISDQQVEQRLSAMREHYEMTDQEVVALARDGALPSDPNFCEWLVLLGHGGLIPRGPNVRVPNLELPTSIEEFREALAAAEKRAERRTASACAQRLDDTALYLRQIVDPERKHKGHKYMAMALCEAAADIRRGAWRPKAIGSPKWPLWVVDPGHFGVDKRYSVHETALDAEEALSESESGPQGVLVSSGRIRRGRRLPLANLRSAMVGQFEYAVEMLNDDPGAFATGPEVFADWEEPVVVAHDGAADAWVAFCELWLDVRVWEVEPDEGALDEACYTAGVAQAQGRTAKVVLEHFGDGVYTARARIEEDSDDE